jgi:hypothetical protein
VFGGVEIAQLKPGLNSQKPEKAFTTEITENTEKIFLFSPKLKNSVLSVISVVKTSFSATQGEPDAPY